MSGNIRKPGQEFELTDEEILQAPPKLLSAAQRKRLRQLRNNIAKQRTRAARKKRREQGGAKVIFCQGYAKRTGEPCGSYAVAGAKHCAMHLNEAEKAKLGRKSASVVREENRLRALEVGGQKMTPSQTARQVMESAVEKLLFRYFRAVGLEFQGFDEEGVPVVYDHGVESGLMLHGESKEGYIEMSKYPDLVGQIQVIEKLWDRVYGKPKQTQVLEGGVKPIRVQPVRNVERAQAVSDLLRRTGAIPHEGRRRSEASEPVNSEPSIENASPEKNASPENVVHLHPEDQQ